MIEPTGPAWLPIAVFFISRGHRRVSGELGGVGGSAPVTCRGTPRPTASMLTPWRGSRCFIPRVCSRSSCRAPKRRALDRRVRAADRLTREIAEHKTRIKALVRQLMPMSPLTGQDHPRRPRGAGTLGRPEPAGQSGRQAARRGDRQGVEQPQRRRTRRGVARRGQRRDRALRRSPGGRVR